MKSIKEIVEETVAYYREDVSRRAKNDNGNCMYYTEDKKVCAVGRCLKSPKDYKGSIIGAMSLLINNDDILKNEYQGHSKEFWYELQALHDTDIYWGINKLSAHGRMKADSIIQKYS